MNKGKIIRSGIAIALLGAGIFFGIQTGIKTSQTMYWAKEENELTEKVETLMKNDKTNQYSIPGTENYKTKKELETKRVEASDKYFEYNEGLPMYGTLTSLCLLGLVYLGVDTLRAK